MYLPVYPEIGLGKDLFWQWKGNDKFKSYKKSKFKEEGNSEGGMGTLDFVRKVGASH